MRQYLDLLRDIRDNGVKREDRTGVGNVSVFGRQLRFDLSQGFPALTTKRVYMKAVIHELLWFLSGSSNIKYLVDNGVHIWDEWAYAKYKKANSENPLTQNEFVEKIRIDAIFAAIWGDLGPVYGVQWRHWKGADGKEIDQVTEVIERIKKNPNDRRMIITAWNPSDLDKMALQPCHYVFHFYVANGKLSCLMNQRSCDVFLGVPFNIASYALLTMMFAHVTGLEPGDFVHNLEDVHIYLNHFEQVELQLSREPRPLPKMLIKRKVDSIFDFRYDDFELVGYNPDPSIKAEVAV